MNLRHVVGAGLVAVAGVVAVVGFTHNHASRNTASWLGNQALKTAGAVSVNTSTVNKGDNTSGPANQSGVAQNSPSQNGGLQNGTSQNSAFSTSRGNQGGNSTGVDASGRAASGGSSPAKRASAGSSTSSTSGAGTNTKPSSSGSSSTSSTRSTTSSTSSSGTSSSTGKTSSSSGSHTTSTPPASLGTFTIVVSKDKGAEVLENKVETIHAGESLLDYMNHDFQIETTYGGQFITSIDGIKSLWTGVPASQRKPVDWFLYINGQEAPVGAGSIMPKAGDVDTWDYHSWDVSTGRG